MRILALLTALLITSPAFAQMEDPLLTLPEGQVILNISATEQTEVQQDLLVANLEYVATNTNSRTLQDEINKAMQKALEEAQKVETVKSNTGSYHVYEFNEQRTKERKWRGSQSLTLKSKNADDLLELAGKLQDLKLNMNGLSYEVSPETYARVKDELMEGALKQLQTRATRAAKTLNKSTAELREVNVQSSGGYAMPKQYGRAMMAMDMAESAPMSAPVASPGESMISLTVSSRAILKP